MATFFIDQNEIDILENNLPRSPVWGYTGKYISIA